MSTAPNPAFPQPQPRKTSVTVLLVIIALCLLGFCVMSSVLAALFLPAVQAAREAARRNACTNNLKQIAIAMMGYHDTYGTLPPAYIEDSSGKPMHSWRVLLLPYLGESTLHHQYDFREPWDGPHNRQLVDKMPDVYRCPSAEDGQGSNYLVVVSELTAFPGPVGMPLANIKAADGTANTVMVVESERGNTNWLEPRDLSLAEALKPIDEDLTAISSGHARGVNVAFCDGHIRFLPADIFRPNEMRSLLTMSGGEKLSVP